MSTPSSITLPPSIFPRSSLPHPHCKSVSLFCFASSFLSFLFRFHIEGKSSNISPTLSDLMWSSFKETSLLEVFVFAVLNGSYCSCCDNRLWYHGPQWPFSFYLREGSVAFVWQASLIPLTTQFPAFSWYHQWTLTLVPLLSCRTTLITKKNCVYTVCVYVCMYIYIFVYTS